MFQQLLNTKSLAITGTRNVDGGSWHLLRISDSYGKLMVEHTVVAQVMTHCAFTLHNSLHNFLTCARGN